MSKFMTRLSKLLVKRLKSTRKNFKLKEQRYRDSKKAPSKDMANEQREPYPLAPDRPILEQIQEQALAGNELAKQDLGKIYSNPKILEMLTNLQLSKEKPNHPGQRHNTD